MLAQATHGDQNAKYSSHFSVPKAGKQEDFLPQSLGAGQIVGLGPSGAVRQNAVHALRRPVWHVLCSIACIELVARVPRRLRWLVQELPPEQEKSARGTAG
jgi:hypothetical protein